jgi:predicted PurR-regulated permease PerM
MVESRQLRIASAVVGIAAALALLYFLRAIIIPLVIAMVLLVLVQALIHAIDRRIPSMPHWLVSISAAVVIFTVAAAAIYVLVQGTTQLVHQGPALFAKINTLLLQASRAFELEQPVQLAALAGNVSLPQLAARLLAGVQGLFSSLMLVLLYFVFLLAERKKVAKKVRRISDTSEQSAVILQGLEQVSEDIETYVWVQTITGIMLAAGSAAIMLSVGLDNALFWTFVLLLLSFIPILGVTVGSFAPALFALLQFSTFWQAITIFGGIQLVAFIVGNLFYPQMQAKTQNISPVATLLSLAFWGALWGMPGAFLSVPLTLILMLICAKFDTTRWVAVLLSNDGEPYTQVVSEGVVRVTSPSRSEGS